MPPSPPKRRYSSRWVGEPSLRVQVAFDAVALQVHHHHVLGFISSATPLGLMTTRPFSRSMADTCPR